MTNIVDSRQTIFSDLLNVLNPNNNLVGQISTTSGTVSANKAYIGKDILSNGQVANTIPISTNSLENNIVLSDTYTKNNYKFDEKSTLIDEIYLKTLWETSNGIAVDNNGKITFNDQNGQIDLKSIVDDIEAVKLIDVINQFGKIYDFQFKQQSFGNYKYANVDRELFSTYPVKTVEEAWSDLKAGNYWPAVDVSPGDVAIKNIYLAYFEPVSLTNYLQPIFVFEGDQNFVAYVPAVSNKYIK